MCLSVCMIVRNEEKILDECLKQVKRFSDELIIVDTGSVDATKEIAARYTDRVYDFLWTGDFSEARNRSFSYATNEKKLLTTPEIHATLSVLIQVVHLERKGEGIR